MTAERKCCDDVVVATAGLAALERSVSKQSEDAYAWRDAHEARNAESFDRAFRAIEAQNAEIEARLQRIEEMLSGRLPLWATIMFAGTGTVIGVLVTIIVTLANHFL